MRKEEESIVIYARLPSPWSGGNSLFPSSPWRRKQKRQTQRQDASMRRPGALGNYGQELLDGGRPTTT